MLKLVIPLLRVRSSSEALHFCRDALGFAVQSTYRPSHGAGDPACHVMTRDGATIHVSSFSGRRRYWWSGSVIVTDIEKLHDELVGKGTDVGLGVMEQPWGDREVYVRDAAGNTARFQSEQR